jgi:hypothetical protein
LNVQIRRLTAELNQKDEQFEIERKRLANEIEGLRRELAAAQIRRVSGFEKSNDMMIGQMEIQISLLQERLKDHENIQEDNENLKMENSRLKSEVEKERLKSTRKSLTIENDSSDGEVFGQQLLAPSESKSKALPGTDDSVANNESDTDFEKKNEKQSALPATDDLNSFKKQPSQTEDVHVEKELLRDEIAALTQELEKQKSIASNMLTPITADDDILAHQLSALHVKVKDLIEQKAVLTGKVNV